MSGILDPSTTPEPDPNKGGLFDERPGMDVNDDPTSPESIAPDVIAPDIESPNSMPTIGPM